MRTAVLRPEPAGERVARVVLVTGCGKILGVDEYRVAPGCGANAGGACGAAVHPTGEAGPSSEAGSGENACGLPYGTTTCASCAHENCCAEATACARSPVCNDYEKCLGACPQGDPACRAQCGIDHPPGRSSEVSALSACLVSHCENECGLPCGALAGWAVEPDRAAAFQTCMASSCDQVRACASSADCDAVTRCFAACPANDCIDTCMDSHGVDPAWWFPDAGDAGSTTSAFVGFARARTGCATAAGGYWECVGKLSSPSVHAGMTTKLETVVADLIDTRPLSGMDVWACAGDDLGCQNPWDHTNTDPRGRISLNIPPATGYLKVTSPTTVPTYFYWGFTLSERLYVEGPGRSGFGTSGVSFLKTTDTEQLLDGGLPHSDQDRGTVMVFVEDCLASAAAGVEVTLSPTDPATFVRDTGLQPTDPITPSLGGLFFYNVPTGIVRVTATPTAIGRPAGFVDIAVRAKAYTALLLRPTPM